MLGKAFISFDKTLCCQCTKCTGKLSRSTGAAKQKFCKTVAKFASLYSESTLSFKIDQLAFAKRINWLRLFSIIAKM